MTTEERFWAKVERVGECLLWTACLSTKGYGVFWDGTRNVRAHRFAYELRNGLIPEGLDCLHNCPGGDNRRCVNADHLFLGTKKDNYDDAVAKGTIGSGSPQIVRFFGERNAAARMSEEQAREILRCQPRTRAELEATATALGVSMSSVKKVLYRQTWSHLDV